jgi:HAD superfamily hydrolase (TIGR01509 family)
MDLVRGIGFDLDHTLAIDNRLERVAFLHLLEVVLADGGRPLGGFADEIDDIDELLQQQRQGEFSIDDAVRRFVVARGLEPSKRYEEWFRRAAVEMVEEFVVPLPGVRRMLDGLRERAVSVAILSNGWNPLQLRKAQQAAFEGPVLVSSEIGEQKPAPGAFERLLQTLGTDAAATWYVGDDPRSDVAGAQAAGMRAVWFNWERKVYPPESPPPDYTIGDLSELFELLPTAVRAT